MGVTLERNLCVKCTKNGKVFFFALYLHFSFMPLEEELLLPKPRERGEVDFESFSFSPAACSI